MYTLKPTLWKIRRTVIFSRYRLRVVPHFSSEIVERAKRERAWKSPHAGRKITFARKFHFLERLKNVRNDLKLSSHSPMDRIKKKSESLIKYYVKVTCAFKWARKLPRKRVTYESAKCVSCNTRKCTHNGFVSDLLKWALQFRYATGPRGRIFSGARTILQTPLPR